MKQRIISALILAPLVILGIFFLPFTAFTVALLSIIGIGFWEWTQFVPGENRWVKLAPLVLGLGVTFVAIPFDSSSLALFTQPTFTMTLVGVTWWLIASLLAITYPNSTRFWSDSRFFRYLFGVLTLVPFFWSILVLRAINIDIEPFYGAKLVMFVCLLVWTADSGAYFAGKRFGKHKMAPSVSPNKTIEGLVGGIIAAGAIGLIAAAWFDIHFTNLFSALVIIASTVIISVLGDLVESMFKRASNIKDSGTIIPGHGGILDRIDSLTAAFPVFTLLYFLL